VEDDSGREDVALGFDVLALVELDDLGRHVAGRAASEEEVLVDVCKGGEAVVDDNWRHEAARPKHDVLGL